MLEIGGFGDALQLGVFDNQVWHERFVQRDVHILVNGRRDQETAVLLIIGGQIRAAAAKADAQR